MEISIIKEAGYEEALVGMSYSYQDECFLEDSPEVDTDKLQRRANRLCTQDDGHNKFLESIMVWMDIRAPLKFWKQFDTYRVGITKQSKSTMHRLMASSLNESHFTPNVDLRAIDLVNEYISRGDFESACDNLPDGYMQTRRVCTSYKVIRGIIKQRRTHKLWEWEYFVFTMENRLEHPELLKELNV